MRQRNWESVERLYGEKCGHMELPETEQICNTMKIKTEKYLIIVHGGAWDIPPDMHQAHLDGVENALTNGIELLSDGATALQAVIRAVTVMEDDPTFDAGYGSFLNKNGEVEMDAIVVDGRDLSFGAVAAIQNVRNPVLVADLIRTTTEHALLVGAGASQFAFEQGIPYYPTENLLIGRELDRYYLLKKQKKIITRQFFESNLPGDTVGAVAMDRQGNIAAATSTGGTPSKLPGRVGDSPLIGCGAYADNLIGGASATGWGESLMKVLLAKSSVDLIETEGDANLAAKEAIGLLGTRVNGRGGVILIDKYGKAGFAFNTPFMARAIADETGIKHIGIMPEIE